MYQGRNMITHYSGHARALFLSALTATNSLDDAGPMSCSVFDIQSRHTAPAVIKHLWVEQESSWPRWALALGSWAGNLTSEVLAFDEGGRGAPRSVNTKFAHHGPNNTQHQHAAVGRRNQSRLLAQSQFCGIAYGQLLVLTKKKGDPGIRIASCRT